MKAIKFPGGKVSQKLICAYLIFGVICLIVYLMYFAGIIRAIKMDNYLEKKYPDHDFSFSGFVWGNRNYCYFKADDIDGTFTVKSFSGSEYNLNDNFLSILYNDQSYEYFNNVAQDIAGDEFCLEVIGECTGYGKYGYLSFDEYITNLDTDIHVTIVIPVESIDTLDRAYWEDHIDNILDGYDCCPYIVDVYFTDDMTDYESYKAGKIKLYSIYPKIQLHTVYLQNNETDREWRNR